MATLMLFDKFRRMIMCIFWSCFETRASSPTRWISLQEKPIALDQHCLAWLSGFRRLNILQISKKIDMKKSFDLAAASLRHFGNGGCRECDYRSVKMQNALILERN